MTAFIVFAILALVVLAGAIIAVLVFMYQQMLMLNEVNKRLLVLAEDAVTNERMTTDELNRRIDDQASRVKEKLNGDDGESEEETPEAFNPHDILDNME